MDQAYLRQVYHMTNDINLGLHKIVENFLKFLYSRGYLFSLSRIYKCITQIYSYTCFKQEYPL